MQWILGSQYRDLEKEIEELTEELTEHWCRILSPKGSRISGLPSSKMSAENTDGVEELCFTIDMENVLDEKIECLKFMRISIENTIENLSSFERRILRMRYIRGFTWQQIAIRTYCDESTCRRVHRRLVAKGLDKC